MTTDYARALGVRLRAIRTQQGLSLHGVEEKSQGRWKAVVVGSYERGDRAVTVQRAGRAGRLLRRPRRRAAARRAARRGRRAAAAAGHRPRAARRRARPRRPDRSPATLPTIQSQRGDYNGRVLSVRQDDLRTLARDLRPVTGVLVEQFIAWGVLNAEARRAIADDCPLRHAGGRCRSESVATTTSVVAR